MTEARPTRLERAAVALLAGAVAFAVAVWFVHAVKPHSLARDFTWPWRAANAVLRGLNPYVVIQKVAGYPYDAPFKYPLPAALVALPFAPLPAWLAGALFPAIGVALFAFAITREGWDRWPLLVSAPILIAVLVSQWGPLLAAGALLPGLAAVWVAKPNLAVVLFAYRPRRAAIVGGVALGLVALALNPRWPLEWLAAVRSDSPYYAVPFTVPGGALLALALLCVGTPEGRLLAVAACVPQVVLFYDQVPLLLVARTRREAWVLGLGSLAGLLASSVLPLAYPRNQYLATVLTVYLPAIGIELRRQWRAGTVVGQAAALRLAA